MGTDLVDSRVHVGHQTSLRFDAEQLDVFLTQDDVVKVATVEAGQPFKGLNKLADIVPLAVEDELAQEEHVVGIDTVDDARLAFQAQLADVVLPAADEFQNEANDVVFAQVEPSFAHFPRHIPPFLASSSSSRPDRCQIS